MMISSTHVDNCGFSNLIGWFSLQYNIADEANMQPEKQCTQSEEVGHMNDS